MVNQTNEYSRVQWELWHAREDLMDGEIDLMAYAERRKLAEIVKR